MSDENPKLQMPEFVRLLLEPYKNVQDGANRPPKDGVEVTFLPKSARPSPEALLAIGSVATEWSILEHMLQVVLTRLALTAQFPVFAVTSDLSIDNRIRAIKSLIALHRDRYGYRLADKELLDALAGQLPVIAALKTRRNVIVHSVWIKGGMKPAMLCQLKGRPRTEASLQASPNDTIAITEITQTADEIRMAANGVFVLSQLLPEADEGLLLELLEQERHRLLLEIQSEPPPQQKPSPE